MIPVVSMFNPTCQPPAEEAFAVEEKPTPVCTLAGHAGTIKRQLPLLGVLLR